MARATATITDSFTGALSGSWTQTRPGWSNVVKTASTDKIRGGDAQPDANRQSMRHTTALADDQWASIKVSQLAWQDANYGMGVTVRHSGSDATRTFYGAIVLLNVDAPNKTVQFSKCVNNTFTTLHSASVAWTTDDRIEIEVEGSEIRVCKNGTPLGGSFTQTDTAITSGSSGVWCSGGSDTYANGDDFEAGEFGSTQSQAPRSMHILNLMRK